MSVAPASRARTAARSSRTTTAPSCTCSSGRTALGGDATVRLRVPRAARADRVLLRYARDGEPRTSRRWSTRRRRPRRLVARDVPGRRTPSTRYRWLLTGGDTGYALAERPRRLERTRSPTRTTSSSSPARRPGLAPRLGRLRDLPRPLRDLRARRARRPTGRCRRAWDELPTGRGPADAARAVRRRPARGSSSTSTTSSRSARTSIYLTPFFPAGSTHRYDATTLRARRPAARRRRGARAR